MYSEKQIGLGLLLQGFFSYQEQSRESNDKSCTNISADFEMARLRAFDLSVFGVVIVAGIYGGTKFFEPIVIDALKKENALRKDIPIPEYSEDGIPVENEKSLANLKTELNEIYEQSRRERGLEPKSLGSSSNDK